MACLASEFVDLLRCPSTGQRLVEAPESVLKILQQHRPTAQLWLLRADGRMAYPVCNGLPLLLKEEGVAVSATEI